MKELFHQTNGKKSVSDSTNVFRLSAQKQEKGSWNCSSVSKHAFNINPLLVCITKPSSFLHLRIAKLCFYQSNLIERVLSNGCNLFLASFSSTGTNQNNLCESTYLKTHFCQSNFWKNIEIFNFVSIDSTSSCIWKYGWNMYRLYSRTLVISVKFIIEHCSFEQ